MGGVRFFLHGVLGLLIAACSSTASPNDATLSPDVADTAMSSSESVGDAAAAEVSDGLHAMFGDLPSRKFYVSGIIGASFASLSSGGMNTAGIPTPNTGTASDDLFTAGGAVGVCFDRPHGLLRAEVEGRGRGQILGETASVEPFTVEAGNGWSVMANVWRDYFFTERLGVYGGGGIGVGGYRLAVEDSLAIVAGTSTAAEFAWQAGGGVTYRVGPHVTLDLGYRFIDLGTASTPLLLGDGSPVGDYTSAFSASELLLTVRIYEPFRQFRR